MPYIPPIKMPRKVKKQFKKDFPGCSATWFLNVHNYLGYRKGVITLAGLKAYNYIIENRPF